MPLRGMRRRTLEDGVMGGDFGMGGLVTAFLVCFAFLPLGVWKFVELAMWVWARVHWGAP
jgi:hypothetical protein